MSNMSNGQTIFLKYKIEKHLCSLKRLENNKAVTRRGIVDVISIDLLYINLACLSVCMFVCIQ